MTAPRPTALPPATCHISARTAHRVATLPIHDDVLVLVQAGVKTLVSHGGQGAPGSRLEIAPHGLVLMARGSLWDIINQPGPRGRYEALVLQFGDELLDDLARLWPQPAEPTPPPPAFALPAHPELEDAVRRAAAALQALGPESPGGPSPRIARHRALEVLILLAEAGCRLPPRGELAWPDRVRRLIACQPQADWSIPRLATACHQGESTLRRHLAAQGTTAAQLVRETRLAHGLALLQTTPLPIGEIAGRCGYDSHSRFTAAFRQRFGFPPSQLR